MTKAFIQKGILTISLLIGFVPSAQADGWVDELPPVETGIMANGCDSSDIGRAVRTVATDEKGRPILDSNGWVVMKAINVGSRGDDSSRYYGGTMLPPVSTAAVNISVTDGNGGFDLTHGRDAQEFLLYAMSRSSTGPSESPMLGNGQTWDEYLRALSY